MCIDQPLGGFMSKILQSNRTLQCDSSLLVLSPTIALEVGRSAAIVLQQLHYWISSPKNYGAVKEGNRWIYNSYQQWHEQIRVLSAKTIQRAFRLLEDRGLIQSQQFKKSSCDQTKAYTIMYERLADFEKNNDAKPRKSTVIRDQNTHNSSISHQDKMSKPSGQNDQILIRKTKKTTENSLLLSQHLAGIQLESKSESIAVVADKEQGGEERINDLLSNWKKWVNPEQAILTNYQKRLLKQAFQSAFEGQTEKWEAYCQKISTSKFLMGEVSAFKIKLDWALQHATIHRILEDGFTFGDRTVASKDIVLSEGNLIDESEDALKTRDRLKKHLFCPDTKDSVYLSWFGQTFIKDRAGELPTLYVANDFVKKTLVTRFNELCEICFSGIEVGLDAFRKENAYDVCS